MFADQFYGKQVEVLIDIDYGDSPRPTGFTVRTVVDGKHQIPQQFSNQ